MKFQLRIKSLRKRERVCVGVAASLKEPRVLRWFPRTEEETMQPRLAEDLWNVLQTDLTRCEPAAVYTGWRRDQRPRLNSEPFTDCTGNAEVNAMQPHPSSYFYCSFNLMMTFVGQLTIQVKHPAYLRNEAVRGLAAGPFTQLTYLQCV